MKHTIARVLTMLIVLITFQKSDQCFAQVPQVIPFQAVARDNVNNPVVNQNVALRFTLHNSLAGGPIIYRETQTLMTNSIGQFTANVGQGTVVIGNFTTINWGVGTKFLQVEMDPAGGTAFVDMGTQQMFSVPYALFSAKSGDLPSGTSAGNTLRWNGTAWEINNTLNNNSTNVGVGTASPSSSAILDASSTSKGFLFPRMTTSQRNSISSPVVGLQIFNLDDLCVDIYDGTNWIKNCGYKVTGNVTDPGHSTANSWTQKANFGGGLRMYATGFSIGSKGYIGGGWNGAFKTDFWEYNPSTNAWTQKANIGGSGRSSPVGFAIGNKGYIGTGENAGVLSNDFWEYDPTTNVWTQRANFGGGDRRYGCGFSIGAKGYIGLGEDLSSSKNDLWEYDPSTNLWTQKANFIGTARHSAAAFSIGNLGYVGTGYDPVAKKDFYEYNPATNAWTQKADFGGTTRWGAVGFSIGTKGYIGTGQTFNYSKDFYEYDPSTNTWTQKGSYGGPGRVYGTGFSIGNKGYIGIGADPSTNSEFWEYMDNNILGSSFSSGTISSNNLVSDGMWSSFDNTVYNSNTGNVGIATSSPASQLDVNGSFGTKLVKSSGTANVTLDNGTSIFYITSAVGTTTFPQANTCTNRRYNIINRSGGSRTTSSYIDLTGATVTTIANNAAIEIVSDGTNWLQIK